MTVKIHFEISDDKWTASLLATLADFDTSAQIHQIRILSKRRRSDICELAEN